jgi:hypothetical protein
MSAADPHAAALIEAHRLIVVVANLASAKALRVRDKEVRNTRVRLFKEQHDRTRAAVAPDDKEDVVKHPSILLLKGASYSVAQRLMSAWWEDVGT